MKARRLNLRGRDRYFKLTASRYSNTIWEWKNNKMRSFSYRWSYSGCTLDRNYSGGWHEISKEEAMKTNPKAFEKLS